MKRYERKHEPLASVPHFARRLFRSLLTALAVFIGTLGIGIVGYHHYEQLPLDESFLNAAMILSGMGPATPITTHEGKIFAGCYALFCGLAFAAMLGFVIAPVAHRLLHKFHLDGRGK